jgi:hypothetical protein
MQCGTPHESTLRYYLPDDFVAGVRDIEVGCLIWDTAKMRLFGVITRHQRLICLSGGLDFIVDLMVTVSRPGIVEVNASSDTSLLRCRRSERAQIPFFHPDAGEIVGVS